MAEIFKSPDFWGVLLIMIAGGILGGCINYLRDPNPPALPTANGAGAANPTPPPSGPPYLWRCIGVGIGAALIVPIFLYLTRSELLSDLKLSAKPIPVQAIPNDSTTSKPDRSTATSFSVTAPNSPSSVSALTSPSPSSSATANRPDSKTVAAAKPQVAEEDVVGAYLVFFGLCVLAAIFGFSFIDSMGSRLLSLVRQANENSQQARVDARDANRKAADSEQKAQKAAQQATQTQQKAQSQEDFIKKQLIGTLNARAAQPVAEEAMMERAASPITPVMLQRNKLIKERLKRPDKDPNADDPQKGRWGENPESEHYRLSATVTPIDRYGRYATIELWVESKDPANHPLTDSVDFFVHPTFGRTQFSVPVQDGRATLQLTAYGVFTAGAVTQDAEMMELDIADIVRNDPRISDDFRTS